MKGGILGLKVSQVSLILIGLVCATVIALAWTKTTFLTSFIPSQSRVLQLNIGSRETVKENSNSVQKGKKPVEPLNSSGVELPVETGNTANVAVTDKGEIPSSIVERTGSEKPIGGKNKSKQAEIVQENSSNVESSVEGEHTRNSSATTGKKGISPGVLDKEGSEEISGGKSKSKQDQIVQENSSTLDSHVEKEQAKNLSATTGKKGISPRVLDKERSDGISGGKNKSKQVEIVQENSSTVDSSVEREQPKNLSATTGKKNCNYAKGKWVFDDSWPLYSGNGCKQWLSPMWACRMTQRTDFEYEKLRWQPKDCEMDDFTGPKFLQRMQDKTLAFVGDSLGRQQFQSLMCMVTGGKESPDVINVGHEYGLVKARGAVRPDGWAYRFPTTNTTILYYWSASLCGLEPINASNPVTDIAMHLDRPPAFLSRFLHRFDVLVLNTGHHWNREKLKGNRWVMYVGGVPNTDREIATIAGAKKFTIHSIVKWVNSQLPLYPGLKAFLRTLAPRHFFNGDWNTGGTCDNTTPLSGGKEVVQDESSDPLAAGAVNGINVKLLDITALSQLRDEGHISRYSIRATPGVQDCLHWCLPGVPDTWNEILFAQI